MYFAFHISPTSHICCQKSTTYHFQLFASIQIQNHSLEGIEIIVDSVVVPDKYFLIQVRVDICYCKTFQQFRHRKYFRERKMQVLICFGGQLQKKYIQRQWSNHDRVVKPKTSESKSNFWVETQNAKKFRITFWPSSKMVL